MAVTLPRETWPDKRLDGLESKVDDGFRRLEKKIDDGLSRVDTDMRELRGDIKGLRSEMNRTIYGAVVVIVGAMIGNNALF